MKCVFLKDEWAVGLTEMQFSQQLAGHEHFMKGMTFLNGGHVRLTKTFAAERLQRGTIWRYCVALSSLFGDLLLGKSCKKN